MAWKRLIINCLLLMGGMILDVRGEKVLRYTKDSCADMEPEYVEENYNSMNLGPQPEKMEVDDDDSNNNKIAFVESPKKISNSRNVPFDLVLDFDSYRKNSEYEIRIASSEIFDSFMLQVRGPTQADGNASYIGSWTDIPPIAKIVSCLTNPKAAVVDKGRPIKMSNLTFMWLAPSEDMGTVRVEASIAFNNQFAVIRSKPIQFNKFPISNKDCGSDVSCFRFCQTDPYCEPEDSQYMITMTPDRDDMVFKMGGILPDNLGYIAIGLGKDWYRLQNTDLVVCYREGNEIRLAHYFVEDENTEPYLHQLFIRLEGSDIDRETNFAWCQFSRPIQPKEAYDLDLATPLHRFYFWGMRNDTKIHLPDPPRILKSFRKTNVSEIVNDIRYFPLGRGAGVQKHPDLLLVTFILAVGFFLLGGTGKLL